VTLGQEALDDLGDAVVAVGRGDLVGDTQDRGMCVGDIQRAPATSEMSLG
jgi:hypothetical protein